MIKPFQKKQGLLIGHEYPPEEETLYTNKMIEDMKAQLLRLYPEGKTLRQAHPKMHGLVKAEFIIEKNLAPELRVGVFKEEKTFDCWIRFSSSSTKVKHDKAKDIRGMTIKLLGVEGEKLLEDQKDCSTQDFLLLSDEIFLAKSVKNFSKFLHVVIAGPLRVALYALNPFHLPVVFRTVKAFKKCTNVLDVKYWSTTPYQLGSENMAVKYHTRPVNAEHTCPANNSDYRFLTTNLVNSLSKGDAWFDFCIQLQTDAVKMPIEDPTVKWTSPFIKVASIRIPKQVFDTDERNDFGENLTYSPWHSLPEHRPLGGINRAQKSINKVLSKFRHDRNNIPVTEPK
jgi:catalase